MAPPVKDISVKEFADLLGVTSARVYQYIQEGMPHRKRGKRETRVVPREAIGWRIQREVDEFRKQASAGGPTRARDRLELAQAELKELEVLKAREAVIPIEEFETFVDALVGGLAAVASGRLQRFEREIVAAATPADARRLTEQIHAALMTGAQEYGEQLDAEAGVLETGEPEPAGESTGVAAA